MMLGGYVRITMRCGERQGDSGESLRRIEVFAPVRWQGMGYRRPRLD